MKGVPEQFLCGTCGHGVDAYSYPMCVHPLCYCQCMAEREMEEKQEEEDLREVDRDPPRNPPTLVARCYLHPDYQGIRRPKVDCKGCRTVYSDRGRLKLVVVS